MLQWVCRKVIMQINRDNLLVVYKEKENKQKKTRNVCTVFSSNEVTGENWCCGGAEGRSTLRAQCCRSTDCGHVGFNYSNEPKSKRRVGAGGRMPRVKLKPERLARQFQSPPGRVRMDGLSRQESCNRLARSQKWLRTWLRIIPEAGTCLIPRQSSGRRELQGDGVAEPHPWPTAAAAGYQRWFTINHQRQINWNDTLGVAS